MTALEVQALSLALLLVATDDTLEDGHPDGDVWLDAGQWRALVARARALRDAIDAQAEATP